MNVAGAVICAAVALLIIGCFGLVIALANWADLKVWHWWGTATIPVIVATSAILGLLS